MFFCRILTSYFCTRKGKKKQSQYFSNVDKYGCNIMLYYTLTLHIAMTYRERGRDKIHTKISTCFIGEDYII